MKTYLFVAILSAIFTPNWTWDKFKDDVDGFCAKVPSEAEIEDYEDEAGSEPMVTPLWEMRECCDKDQSMEKQYCLEEAAGKEVRMMRDYLEWTEADERNQEYVAQLKKCKNTFKNIDVWARKNCATKKREACVDPIGFYMDNCTDNNLGKDSCAEGLPRAIRHGALASYCLNDKDGVYKKGDESAFYHCFNTQGLSPRLTGLRYLAGNRSMQCIEHDYGIDTTWKGFETKQLYTGNELFKPYWPNEWYKERGIFGDVKLQADDFLTTLCQKEDSKKCLLNPITQTFLTFKSNVTITNEINACCSMVDSPLPDDDDERKAQMDILQECLEEDFHYMQFYPVTGWYMRSIFRNVTHLLVECENPQSLAQGRYYEPLKPDLFASDQERLDYLGEAADPRENRFSNGFNMKKISKISPKNYHFFLRNISDSDSSYYDAAKKACKVGELKGKQAYSFPGLLCPSLVANHYLYSEDVKKGTMCPDMTFYEFQVAHYCCLSAAYKKYNYYDFDKTSCPDVSDVKDTTI